MKVLHKRRWDWPSAFLLIFMLQAATARLVVTRWTDYLYYAQTLAAFGSFLGLAIGQSQFSKRVVRWLALGYSVILIPWQLSLVIDKEVLLSERLASVGGRLLFSIGLFFQRESVEDSLLFVAFIAILAWIISLVSSYWWARHGNYLVAVLPGGFFILAIQVYDKVAGSRIWLLGFYILLALLLLGRLYYLQNRDAWQKRRVFVMQENAFDIARGMTIAAVLFVFVAWSVPASQAGVESAARTWRQLTKPWREMQEWLSNATDPLEAAPSPGFGDFYGSRLALGTGNPLSEAIIFNVQAPELLEEQARLYWRGYVYDLYQGNRWANSETSLIEFSPSDAQVNIPDSGRRNLVLFTVTTEIRQSLLYTAAQPVWVSRPGNFKSAEAGEGELDVFAWQVESRLAAGERYQVRATIADPSIQELQAAGAEYPQWVTDRYLQLPDNFSPRIQALADEITQGLENPYDKAAAITAYLRREITYVNPLPEPLPEEGDPLEWVLFDLKQGFCNYYASAEVLMLRSLGIPARMAVGFAEGELNPETFVYAVRSRDAHAWPEVFFPGIGWIEFEPTGNQAPLVRPDRPVASPRELEPTIEPINPNAPDQRPETDQDRIGDETDTALVVESRAISPILYLGITVIVIGLLWFMDRQYALIDQIPMRLQAVYERSGGQVPAWVINWTRWSALSPIERSFETINRSLRLLGEKPALYHTPSERALSLAQKLPKAEDAINVLSEQQSNSLFTPNPGDVGSARHASLKIWLYTIQSIIQNLIEGSDK